MARKKPVPKLPPNGFQPEKLDRTVIALPLIEKIEREGATEPLDVVIDLNLNYSGGRDSARDRTKALVDQAIAAGNADRGVYGVDDRKSSISAQYVFARLNGELIEEILRLDAVDPKQPDRTVAPSTGCIFRVWLDFEIKPLITATVSTIKVDAARNSFAASGDDIVWAVMDSGIDNGHKHFVKHDNLDIPLPVAHQDFTAPTGTAATALTDRFGHGTHVAGIIAGEVDKGPISAVARRRVATVTGVDTVTYEPIPVTAIAGMAPKCKLVSLKVLGDDGKGRSSNLIAAISYIQDVNGHGRDIKIHGVNMSVGYDFDPEWFACGQSPLCVEVNRLVKSGVVVVVAAGNTGYGYTVSQDRGTVASGLALTINDPGNAELAITVGSTHRTAPHTYGVSYFSSKGPTGDGRRKPDLVAPGEKIISCATGNLLAKVQAKLQAAAAAPPQPAPAPVVPPPSPTPAPTAVPAPAPPPAMTTCDYTEDSGTSMAAPHVSGAIAAFLSVRGEFVGRAEEVKDIFLSSATDLKRDPYFQGHGLIDLMRAIQSV